MRRRLLCLSLAVAAVFSCTDWFGPPLQWVRLQIVPVFDRHAFQQSDPDLVRVRIFIDSAGVFPPTSAVDDTLPIDPVTKEVSGDFTIPLLQSPLRVLVLLDCFRSSDGVVLFSGRDTIEVTSQPAAGDSTARIEIQVPWVGPSAGRVEITPRDTSIAEGGSFTFEATVYDTAGNEDPGLPARFRLASPGDSVVLMVDRYSGVATAGTGVDAVVSVIAFTLDSFPVVEDTARVAVGAVPASVEVLPGFLNVGIGSTATVTATVFDAAGIQLPVGVAWTSRNTSVAAVDAAGNVMGVAAGTAIVVATESALGNSDSLLVTVPPEGNVVVTAFGGDRAFAAVSVGDIIAVDVLADMRFTPDELLGSYNATLTWDQTVMEYMDVQAVDFATPTINESNVASGELRFGSADAGGTAGQVVVARIRFRALGVGSGSVAISISEMSAAVTFTNLLSRVTVTNGTIEISSQ